MKNKQVLLYLAWGIALTATLGSIYFSEILKFPPCVLCWYQRIAIYPQVFILGAGILTKNRNIAWYSLPLLAIGGLISIYHNLLYYNILPEAAAPCIQGISCTTQFINWFGFVTIPLLSLGAIVSIFILVLNYSKLIKKEQ